MEKKGKKLSRKEFFRAGGSTVAGVAILGMAGTHLYKMLVHPEQAFYDEPQSVAVERGAALPSPYRKRAAFKTEMPIVAFELHGQNLYIATSEIVSCCDMAGMVLSSFKSGEIVRDLSIYQDKIYLLHPTKISVHSLDGQLLSSWEACSSESDYSQMTVFDAGVFVTDAANKNICKYTLDGSFRRFINSPEGFIVPSYSFGITNIDGVVYCSNPGRHKIESYTADGEFIASFGKVGNGDGCFAGCCNPVYLTSTSAGDIITSEKGNPRVSCYGRDGKFHATLLDKEALGVGNVAREVRTLGRSLIVVADRIVSIFEYDEKFAESTACGTCDKDCPLRQGVNI